MVVPYNNCNRDYWWYMFIEQITPPVVYGVMKDYYKFHPILDEVSAYYYEQLNAAPQDGPIMVYKAYREPESMRLPRWLSKIFNGRKK